MSSVFNREMVEAAVEAEFGHTYIHWRYEFDKWLKAESRRILEDEPDGLEL